MEESTFVRICGVIMFFMYITSIVFTMPFIADNIEFVKWMNPMHYMGYIWHFLIH